MVDCAASVADLGAYSLSVRTPLPIPRQLFLVGEALLEKIQTRDHLTRHVCSRPFMAIEVAAQGTILVIFEL
jgi:hypothetical protein